MTEIMPCFISTRILAHFWLIKKVVFKPLSNLVNAK